MTVPSEINRSGPYNGNGVTTVFDYEFRIIDEDHLRVVHTSALATETVLLIDVDYSVADVGEPGGGRITLVTPPATGETLTILRNVPFKQETDLENQGAYYAETVEDALDLAAMRDQQLVELAERSLRMPESYNGDADPTLPVPEANKLIGWNDKADRLQNMDAGILATIVAYGTANADLFTGDGVTTEFALTGNPGVQNNLDVAIGGVTQLPGVDYLWSSGTVLTFTTAPANGVTILARYMQALAQGASRDDLVTYTPAPPGTVTRTLREKLRDIISVSDFGAVGDGVANDTAAVQAAIDYCGTYGRRLEFARDAVYRVSALSTSYNSGTTGFHIDLCGSTIKSNGGSVSPLITLLNAKNITISNGTLDGNFSLAQTTLVKIWGNDGTHGSSFHVLNNIRLRNAQYGVQLGDPTRADEPFVSENTMIGCNAMGVLNPAIVYGVQGELNCVGCDLAANANGWVTLPGSYTVNALTAVGGNIRMTGGEITSYVDQGVSIRPIASGSGNLYGKVFCVGTWCECQHRLAVAENPAAVASPVGGVISFIGCAGGVVLSNTNAAIDTATDFTGDIEVSKCSFFSGAARTLPNINAATGARVFVDSKSFNPYIGMVPAMGAGFLSGIAGFNGGKLFYDSVAQVTAASVEQNAAQSLPNAAWTKIALQNEIFDTNSNFNTTTYRFTPTTPGYYQVNAQLQIDSSGSAPGIDIYKNGASTGYTVGGFVAGLINGTVSISRLLYLNGTTDYLELFGIQGTGSAKNTVAALTQMSISYARAA